MPRLLVVLLLLMAQPALAARLEVPLRVPLDAVREAMKTALGTSLYRDGRCRYLSLGEPRLEADQGRLRLTGPGTGSLGAEIGGTCRRAVGWRGTVDFTLVPRIDEAGKLRVKIVESGLSHASAGINMLWDLAKPQVHARLERAAYDLGASREALTALLRSAVPPGQAPVMEDVLKQMQVLPLRVGENEVVVPIALELPDAWLAPPAAAASAAPLTEAEMDALDEALQPWDAFLVYIVRQAAIDGPDSQLRRRLFTLLLDSRYQLVSILSGEATADGDPLRALFLETWAELRTILADAQRAGTLPPSLLRYALFVDAGDALVALENAAPGLALSADGLRQLARSLKPGDSADPLAYQWDVDTELRTLFDVPELPEPQPPAPLLPTRSWLDFFIGRAFAAQSLDRWVPTRDELPAYTEQIGEVLRKAAASASLPSPYDTLYRNLVPTTALIESCWRQYVPRAGKVTYLRSVSHSVGIMQVNQKVWRGFYEVNRLRWDTAYNIRAGAQILARYVKDYAIPYAEKTGDPKVIPRAAYAVYNAGPRAVGRFAKAKPHPREARVDDKLWALYQGIAAGGQVDLASCGVKEPAGQ